MKAFLQLLSCLLLALGVALLVAGQSIAPPEPSPVAQMERMVRIQSDQPSTRETARATCTGLGSGFAVLGALGLAVPWVNTLVKQRTQTPNPKRNDSPTA